ncbi:PTS sugar transporter subunit IIA [Aureimonas frigidaquae]|uniref:PTS sugar transporter subunit IIA n=1 Tax=Aureimonas frigidaquae TaxID=424757 RepID=UPI0007851ACD|nr:PTS sugar transporter subunit IIA [Aureimonas frigidaquae]
MPLDFIRPDAVIASLRAHSKKQVLQELSERAALLSGLDERDIVDAVTRRERLGSTGVGNGIAIPHGKMKALPGMVGVFGRAGRPIEFEALDDEPVDLFFLLLAPEDSGADHLKALSRVARLLRNPDMVADLRAAHDAPTIHRLLSQGGAL